jgi:HPt (histidine-containing phosphotransfer) domain-containing protein
MKGDREQCLAAGMDGYVAKPVQAQELYAVISRLTPTAADAKPDADAAAAQEFNLETMRSRLGGDMELLREFVQLFRERCPEMLAEIQAAVAQADAEQLMRAAHTFKGTVCYLSTAAAEAADRLETMGQLGDLTTASETFHRLVEEVNRLQPSLARLSSSEKGELTASQHES